MLAVYKGGNKALNINAGRGLIRFPANKPVLITKAQANEFQARDNVKKLIKAKQLEFIGLDSLDKDELLEVAIDNNFNVTGKEKIKDLIDLLSGTDNETEIKDDDTGDDTGTDLDKEPTEK